MSIWMLYNKYFWRFGFYIVPYQPTAKMLKGASKPLEMYRADDEWFSCAQKHKVRYQSMLLATAGKKHPLIISNQEQS